VLDVGRSALLELFSPVSVFLGWGFATKYRQGRGYTFEIQRSDV
jgi:hypothetical protein